MDTGADEGDPDSGGYEEATDMFDMSSHKINTCYVCLVTKYIDSMVTNKSCFKWLQGN